ncbi:hypothetical protein [Pseudonocardia kongjuensis]|uniref:hypothetical protein n=1 Tax=Pseudonocardia kongjuensis TaxID=102227 RepID=UPI0031E48F0C
MNEPGPVLVDSTGAPLPADIAKSVRTVYTALDTGDLDPVHAAYSATGSDDWHTTEPHLGQGIVRQDVLAALRTPPAPGADTYIYSASGTSATFGWSSMGTGIGPGLHSISGPWLDFTTSTLDTSAPPEPLTPATADDEPPVPTSCTAGTLDQPIEGYPCTDPGTGRGVDYDGTVGVHGLKPCPYGTDIPTDPNEPTRNASTGETCGWSG